MPPASVETHDHLSLVFDGPFHGMLRQLGLIGPDHFLTQGADVNLEPVTWKASAELAAA